MEINIQITFDSSLPYPYNINMKVEYNDDEMTDEALEREELEGKWSGNYGFEDASSNFTPIINKVVKELRIAFERMK